MHLLNDFFFVGIWHIFQDLWLMMLVLLVYFSSSRGYSYVVKSYGSDLYSVLSFAKKFTSTRVVFREWFTGIRAVIREWFTQMWSVIRERLKFGHIVREWFTQIQLPFSFISWTTLWPFRSSVFHPNKIHTTLSSLEAPSPITLLFLCIIRPMTSSSSE